MPAAEEIALNAAVACLLACDRARLHEQVAIGAARGVEAFGQSGVGVAALALGGVASEPPDGDGERKREKQKRRQEPDPAGSCAYFLPPRRLEAGCPPAAFFA